MTILLYMTLQYKNIDIINSIKMLQVKLYMSSGNYKKAKDVLIAMIDTQGKFYYQLYDKNEKEKGAKK